MVQRVLVLIFLGGPTELLVVPGTVLLGHVLLLNGSDGQPSLATRGLHDGK